MAELATSFPTVTDKIVETVIMLIFTAFISTPPARPSLVRPLVPTPPRLNRHLVQ